MSEAKRLILVTGCSRSGTTAIGANLALAAGTRYIYEPFNSQTGLVEIDDRFPVPGAGTFPVDLFDRCVDRLCTLSLKLRPGVLRRDRGWQRLFKRYIGSRTRLSYLSCRIDFSLKTIIWKDPLAVFAAEAAAKRHQIPVVVTVRPPVAVAASFKRMRWTPRVDELEARLGSIGHGDAGPIGKYRDKLDQSAIASAILWRMAYRNLLRLAREVPSVYLLNVQDFVERPVERYRTLYRLIDLPWSERVASQLARRHRPRQPGGATSGGESLPDRAHVAKRDLRAINEYGRKLLTASEIADVEEITGELWLELNNACIDWSADPPRSAEALAPA